MNVNMIILLGSTVMSMPVSAGGSVHLSTRISEVPDVQTFNFLCMLLQLQSKEKPSEHA